MEYGISVAKIASFYRLPCFGHFQFWPKCEKIYQILFIKVYKVHL